MSKKNKINRRQFLTSATVATVGAATIGTAGLLTSCSGGSGAKAGNTAKQPIERLKNYRIPTLTDMAVDGKTIKVGLVGCGGQGTGDLLNMLKAANGIEIVALGDAFQDKVDGARGRIKENTGIEVPADKCFAGLDAYQKVIDSGIDLVMLATPPLFYSQHFEAAIRAGKHVFMEKPVSIDVAGSLKILATSKIAETQGLSVVVGTLYRHQRSYVEAFKQIADGAIGEITGGTVYYNTGMSWYRSREKGWSDTEYMLRDWPNWYWLSGDHIIEQHIHNIDIFNWFCGLKPINATSFGARMRRFAGDCYDFFSTDFVFENNVHMHSMCRQIDGCTNNVSNVIQGTHGVWMNVPQSRSELLDIDGNSIWKWDFEKEKQEYKQTNAYVLELVDLITAIRTNKPVNEVEAAISSSFLGIMGRESAYTGKTITFDELRAMNMDFMPADLRMDGSMDMSKFHVPIPGTGK